MIQIELTQSKGYSKIGEQWLIYTCINNHIVMSPVEGVPDFCPKLTNAIIQFIYKSILSLNYTIAIEFRKINIKQSDNVTCTL